MCDLVDDDNDDDGNGNVLASDDEQRRRRQKKNGYDDGRRDNSNGINWLYYSNSQHTHSAHTEHKERRTCTPQVVKRIERKHKIEKFSDFYITHVYRRVYLLYIFCLYISHLRQCSQDPISTKKKTKKKNIKESKAYTYSYTQIVSMCGYR